MPRHDRGRATTDAVDPAPHSKPQPAGSIPSAHGFGDRRPDATDGRSICCHSQSRNAINTGTSCRKMAPGLQSTHLARASSSRPRRPGSTPSLIREHHTPRDKSFRRPPIQNLDALTQPIEASFWVAITGGDKAPPEASPPLPVCAVGCDFSHPATRRILPSSHRVPLRLGRHRYSNTGARPAGEIPRSFTCKPKLTIQMSSKPWSDPY